MAVTSDQVDSIGTAQELHISTYRADGTLRKSIPIWAVRVGDDLYIRSAFGPDAGWYRHAIADNVLHIRTDGVDTDVAVQPAADAATNSDVDAAYKSKYADGGSALDTMVTAPAVGTTVRLVGTAT